MKLGLTLLRVIVGVLFVGHGMQKLKGWFGGHGPDGTGQFFESLGFQRGRDQAVRAGAAEAGGGALLALGLATPLAASLISAVMITAIETVHRPNGPWVAEGGYEYNLMIVAAMAALADVGPGDVSLDNALGWDLHGPGWAIVALGAGAAGAASALSGRKAPAPAAVQGQAGDPASA